MCESKPNPVHNVFLLLLFSREVVSHSFATPWTVTLQAPQSMGFSMQKAWSGVLFPSPGDPPDPGIKPWSPGWPVDSLPLSHPGSPSNVLKFNPQKDV